MKLNEYAGINIWVMRTLGGMLFIMPAFVLVDAAVNNESYLTALAFMPFFVCGLSFLSGRTLIPYSKLSDPTDTSVVGSIYTFALCLGAHYILLGLREATVSDGYEDLIMAMLMFGAGLLILNLMVLFFAYGGNGAIFVLYSMVGAIANVIVMVCFLFLNDDMLLGICTVPIIAASAWYAFTVWTGNNVLFQWRERKGSYLRAFDNMPVPILAAAFVVFLYYLAVISMYGIIEYGPVTAEKVFGLAVVDSVGKTITAFTAIGFAIGVLLNYMDSAGDPGPTACMAVWGIFGLLVGFTVTVGLITVLDDIVSAIVGSPMYLLATWVFLRFVLTQSIIELNS